MLKAFLSLVATSVVLSFHETLWAWAPVPTLLAFGVVAAEMYVERIFVRGKRKN